MIKDGLLSPVPPQILTERVYEGIKALLMDQQLEPGSRINIERLARDLHVSATPVREALARLESDGLVVKQPLRRYTSAPLIDPVSFVQLFELRLLIEPFAARRTAALGSRHDFDELEELVDAMRRGKTGESYAENRGFAQQDAKFHAAIALASGNLLLHDTLVRLHPHVHLNRLFFHTGPAVEAINEHAAIVAALRRRDDNGAEQAMRDHIERSRARLEPAVAALQPLPATHKRRAT